MYFNVIVVYFLLSLLLNLLQLGLLFVLRFIDLFLGALFSFYYFVTELQHLLHKICVLVCQLFNQDLAVLHLPFEVLNKAEVVATDS